MSCSANLLIRTATLFGLLGAISTVQGAQGVNDAAGHLQALTGPGFTAIWTDEKRLEFSQQDCGADSGEGGYRWKAPPAEDPDHKGLTRDTGYFLVYQAAIIGLLYVMPESVSGWSDEDKDEYSFQKWRDNVGNPHRDNDTHFINYVTHPYWGATYYVRGQQRGLDRTGSFWYSVLLSTLFEFGMEALFEPPSYQDLWTTPVIGSLLGEFWFIPVRERIRAKFGPLDWKDKTLLALTDPLGVASEESDRLLGIQTELKLVSFDTRHAANALAAQGAASLPSVVADAALGSMRPAIGLQFRVRW